MKKQELIRKLGSRKFWACVSAVIIALVAFFNAPAETTERIVALVSAIGGLCVYMLSEGLADSKPTDITNVIKTEDYKEE
ncbi:putative membrane protein [Peptoniphilus sp. ING2-D1G]|nr:putative membrane protein [Peptoniphilus sp. ING2-D1G]